MNRSSHVRFALIGSPWPVLIAVFVVFISCPLFAWAHSEGTESLAQMESSPSTTRSGCDRLQPTESSGKINKNWLKTQQSEWALGSQLAANAERNVEMLTDDFVVKYVNQIEQRIVDRSQLPGCFAVKILIDPEPNAYSLPGGFIYVTTGLVKLADTEAELAGALAHETAHVTLHHMTRFQTQTRIWRRFALFSSPAGYLLRRYLGPLMMFNLIRKEEFEADRIGMEYQTTAGYDSLEFCRLLQNAIPEDQTRMSLLDRLYDTHPATRSRVKRLQPLDRHSTSSQVGYLVNTSAFDAMKTHFANLNSP